VRVGMSSCDIGVSWLLPRCVGMSRAFDIMLTGRMVDAAEAERIGLVSETVDDARLLPRALEIARTIVANSAFGVWMTKRGAWANVESASLQAAIELENRTQILARTTGGLAEAAEALLARRKQWGPSGEETATT
jgi:enoyl-CoA hydratase